MNRSQGVATERPHNLAGTHPSSRPSLPTRSGRRCCIHRRERHCALLPIGIKALINPMTRVRTWPRESYFCFADLHRHGNRHRHRHLCQVSAEESGACYRATRSNQYECQMSKDVLQINLPCNADYQYRKRAVPDLAATEHPSEKPLADTWKYTCLACLCYVYRKFHIATEQAVSHAEQASH